MKAAILTTVLSAVLVACAPSASPDTPATPRGGEGGYFQSGELAASVVLDAYVDPLCAGCANIFIQSQPEVEAALLSGRLTVRTYPVSFVAPGSLAAVNAWACAQDQGSSQYEYQLFVNQPPQGTPQWSTEALTGMAKAAGVPDMEKFSKCVDSGEFTSWARSVTAQARKDGVTRVPQYSVNGVALQDAQYSVTGLLDALGIADPQ